MEKWATSRAKKGCAFLLQTAQAEAGVVWGTARTISVVVTYLNNKFRHNKCNRNLLLHNRYNSLLRPFKDCLQQNSRKSRTC
ncbi:hypothetical protein [Pyrobaculum genetic element 1]|nr:hypothetical protein [Pyrobaculum genetic element 1]